MAYVIKSAQKMMIAQMQKCAPMDYVLTDILLHICLTTAQKKNVRIHMLLRLPAPFAIAQEELLANKHVLKLQNARLLQVVLVAHAANKPLVFQSQGKMIFAIQDQRVLVKKLLCQLQANLLAGHAIKKFILKTL
jgi:hypothetical protein